MHRNNNIFITSSGMACPVGLSAASACAAKRAGLSALENLPYLDNSCEPIVGAMVPGLDWTLPRASRLNELLSQALADLLHGPPDMPWDQIPLLLCLAEPERPGGGSRNAGLVQSIVNHLYDAFGVHFHPSSSRVFPTGHTAGFLALHEARRLIQQEQVPACLVCGVDSLLNATTLQWLDEHHRLKTPANRDGVIPGEAAAAVLVQAEPWGDTHAEVIGIGFGQEQASILSGEPLLGLGLTAAARSALAEAKLGLHEIDLRLSDVAGELYGFKELPLMEGRLMRVVRKQAQPLWHWAEAIGDSGAAAGIAQLVLADQAFRKGYAPGTKAMGLTSSVAGSRAATILRAATLSRFSPPKDGGTNHGL
ncbi:3-oxoacyl-ACP synthase [Pseudomonas chlororaphis subsp. aurantiaca]|nr:3-oxoacyl-ACP synthase [Pseudomonas chlororaphis subsp. aurantiaca]